MVHCLGSGASTCPTPVYTSHHLSPFPNPSAKFQARWVWRLTLDTQQDSLIASPWPSNSLQQISDLMISEQMSVPYDPCNVGLPVWRRCCGCITYAETLLMFSILRDIRLTGLWYFIKYWYDTNILDLFIGFEISIGTKLRNLIEDILDT